MNLESMKAWFAVQVWSRSESKVASILEHKGYECFLPTYESKRKWANRTQTLQSPLFPGYVFCRLQEHVAGLVMTTPGVVRVLGFGKRPYAVSDDEIHAIQKASLGEDVGPYAYLHVGQKVRIRSGPLAGLVGILTQKRNKYRLVVSVQLIMKSMSIEVDPFNLGCLQESEASLADSAQSATMRAASGLNVKAV